MTIKDDNIEELDASASSDTLDDAADSADEALDTAVGAESSDAQQGEEEVTSLSVVRDVVDESRGEPEADSPPAGEEDGEQGAEGDQAAEGEKTGEEFADVPFNKHPRFQQLLKQRNDFKVDAERYQNVQTFMDDNNLTAEEVADGFVTMALLKTDPVKAWERVKPIVQDLLIAAGELVPSDLQQRVDAGELTPQAAMEISRSRAQVQTVTAQQTFAEQRAQREREMEQTRSITGAATAWEADRRARDPNFEAKMPLLMREIAFLQMSEGKPTTPAGVQDQLKRAYDTISKTYRAPAAAQQPVRKPAARPSSGSAPSNAAPKPESTLDIIRANRAAG